MVSCRNDDDDDDDDNFDNNDYDYDDDDDDDQAEESARFTLMSGSPARRLPIPH